MNEFDALNEVLMSINEMPIDDINDIDGYPLAQLCKRSLNTLRKECLSTGWNFNTLDLTFSPNPNGMIVIPNHYLAVISDNDTDIVVRDWKLFRKSTQSFIFTESVTLNVVDDLSFNDLPFTCANYIVKLASLQMFSEIVADVNGISIRDRAVRKAELEMKRFNRKLSPKALTTGTFYTNLLDRG